MGCQGDRGTSTPEKRRPRPKMTLGNPKSPWFRQSHQWLWAGVALTLAILSAILLQQWRESVRLNAERIEAASKLDQAGKRQEQLASDMAAYDELAEKYS